MAIAQSIILFLISYLIGSIPIGYLFAKFHGIADIRNHGSGGTGATNVSRSLGIHAFFIVFILDALKAYVWIFALHFYQFPSDCITLAAIGLLLGNGYSVFLNGRAGKGVATSFGVLFVLEPRLLFMAAILWLAVLIRWRTVGIASIAVLVGLPIISLKVCSDSSLIFFMGAWGLFLHRDNIREYVRKFGIS